MKQRIAHLADIHITRNPARHGEYSQVFGRTVAQLEADKPDAIVIGGDLFHDYIAASNEATLLAGSWLLALSAVAPVIIIRGNHDYDTFRQDRVDSIQTVVDLLDTSRVRYLNTTGFYQDENVVWVAWRHGQALSPWNVLREGPENYPATFYRDDLDNILATYGSVEEARQTGLTFIDLFHDPISGAKAFNGETFSEGGYLSTSALEGDLALLGDIHLRQYFYRTGENTPFAAYSGSLLQQHYGERVTGHGYLLWDLAGGVPVEREIPNDTAFYTVYVGEGTDYDNLSLDIPYETVKDARVRVYFTDRSVHFNQENKTKLRRYLRERYEATEVRFDPHCTDQRDNAAVQTELDAVDVTDAGVQRDLLVRYLQDNGVAEDMIQRLLELDATISDRLRVSEGQEGETTGSLAETGEYRLLRLRGENFLSTESFDVDFSAHPGLWQITGRNETGKTSLASAIPYLQYGLTLGTVVIKNGEVKSRPEQNGENRYINNKRDLDYCWVEGDYEVGDTRLRLQRRTERKWKRAKAAEPREISKCSTTFKVFTLTADGQVDTDESVDKRRRTEKLAQEIFGTFDDFLRNTFFSADTMAGLLSLDRAVFIDTILRDVKLDVYDRKLKIFRQWKTEVAARSTRLVLNQEAEETKLSELTELKTAAELRLEEARQEVTGLEAALVKGQEYRTEQQALLLALPAGLENVTEAQLRGNVHKAVEAIHQLGTQEQDLLRRMEELPASYDEALYTRLKAEIDQSQGWVRERKTTIQGVQYQLDAEINQEVHLKGVRQLLVAEYDRAKAVLQQGKQTLSQQLAAFDEQLRQLEHSKVCPTCQREKDANAVAAIAQDIVRRQQERVVFEGTGLRRLEEAFQSAEEAVRLKNRENKAALTATEARRLGLETEITARKQEINDQQVYYLQQGEALAVVDQQRQQVERRLLLAREGEHLPLKRRELELGLQESRQALGQFEQAEKIRLHNETVRQRLAKADTLLVERRQQLGGVQQEVARLHGATIPQYTNQVTQLTDTLARYAEQQSRETLWSLYEKAIHRDGLPMQLVRRALSSINEQMAELQEGLSFTIYLDEELEFRMTDHRGQGANQHILQGSGMQRTFASLVLRLGLRRLNHRSRSNLLIMDEMLGKLDPDNTVRYAELLRTATASVEHVMIIEHHGEGLLQPDHLLKVSAQNGVSRYELITG